MQEMSCLGRVLKQDRIRRGKSRKDDLGSWRSKSKDIEVVSAGGCIGVVSSRVWLEYKGSVRMRQTL